MAYGHFWSPRTASAAELAREMGVTPDDVAMRKAFVDLGPADVDDIVAIAPIVASFSERGIDLFFGHLRRFPQADGLFGDTAILERARMLKAAHLRAMASGHYDVAYAEHRLELALLYSRVDLDVRVFVGAFHHLMQGLGRAVVQAHRDEPETGFRRFMAFKKVAFFDIGLIVDALVHERERTIRLQQLALRSIGDGVIATDAQGRVSFLNPVAEALTGTSAADAVGRPIADVFRLVHAQTRAPTRNPIEVALATGSIVGLATNTALVARDGSERLVADSAAPIRDDHGRIHGAVVVFRDVSEKTRMEEELQRASTLESLGVLAGGIAHDFNNLLTGILGNVTLARMQAGQPDKVKARLADAEAAGVRAKNLTRQLLTFARGGAPSRVPTALGPLVEEWTRFGLAGSAVRPLLRVAPDLWPVEADPGQIAQVLQNLVLNAHQAMPDGGDLRVLVANVVLTEPTGLPIPGGRYVRIDVVDTGTGIEPHVLPRVFDPFFTTKPKCSGLGLATAFSIVKKHDGHVTVESEVGRGSTFTVYLPAAAVATAEPRVTQPTAAGAARGRVLLMDDEEMIRGAASQMLALLGYTVAVARDGAEAIERYREARRDGQPFDVVVLDLTVPGGMGGVQAVRELRAIDPAVRAVVSSGYSADPVLARFRDHGFQDVIPKPYTLDEMGVAIRRVLGGLEALAGV